MSSFFKIDRSLFDHWIWNEKPYDKLHAWIYLLGNANFSKTKRLYRGELQTTERGQLHTSRKRLASDWGWSVSRVDRYLRLLKREGMCIVDGTPNGITLTIENYEKYQGRRYTNDTPDDTAGDTPNDTPGDTHNKNELNKKEKNDNNPSDQNHDYGFFSLTDSQDEELVRICGDRFLEYVDKVNDWIEAKKNAGENVSKINSFKLFKTFLKNDGML